MLKEFFVQSRKSQAHNSWAMHGYPSSHPYRWDVKDKWGVQCVLLSKRDDYKRFAQIMVDADQIGISNFYLDHSPARSLIASIAPPPRPLVRGEIDSDVIVLIDTVDSGGNKTLINGTIFYFDPKLKNLHDSALRAAFHDSAAISVTTPVKPYDFNPGHTYIFENLREVSVSYNRIIATDARMPNP